MNERTLRPGNIAAAALVIGGVLLVALPRYGMSIVRLVIVTVAAAAGLYALAVNAPPTWWMSPFDRSGRPWRKGHGSREVAWIRSRLCGRRQRVENGPPLPSEAVRLLQPLIEVALEREGIDPTDRASMASARGLLSPLTLAVLTSGPPKRAPWFRTIRSDRRETAEVVHAVLDDLDRLRTGGRDPRETLDPATRDRHDRIADRH